MKKARKIISIALAMIMIALAMPITFAVNEDTIGGTMLYDFEYTTDAAEAAASDGKLQWIPSYELPVFDNKNKPDGKTHYERAEEWRQEGYPLYAWPNITLEKSAMNATVVSAAEGEPVLFGNHSLKVEVDFSGYDKDGNCNCYIRTTDPDHYFEGMPKKLGAWIYVPEGMENFALYLNTADNKYGEDKLSASYAPVSTMSNSGAENWVGWKYVEIDLANMRNGYYQGCGVFWISYQPGIENGAREKATVYLDNIQLIYDENTEGYLPDDDIMLYDFEYTTDTAEAAASDGKLQWIPSYELPVFDNNNKPDGKTHYERAEEWRQEGYPLYAWPNASLEKSAMNATVVSAADGEPVLFGDHSLKVETDFSDFDRSSNCNCFIRTTDLDHYFEGMPNKLGAWIYVPEGMANFALYLNLCNKDNGITYAPVSVMNGSTAQNWVGWKYVEIDLINAVSGSCNISPNSYPYGYYQGCGIFWISLQPGIPNGALEKATVYLDNIQLIYDTEEHLLDAGEITTQPCVKPGVFTYTCQDCDLTVTREIPALGYHFPGAAAVENETESTCAVSGGFDTVVRCTRCNEIISSEHTAYPLSEHTFEGEWTYDWDNLVRWRKCSLCDARETEPLETEQSGGAEIVGPVDDDSSFDVAPVSTDYVLIKEALGEMNIVKAFDITLKNNDGVHVQPKGTVKVKLPNDFKSGSYKIYRVNDDGTYTDMNAFREGSHLVFYTDHFSLYVIVEESAPALPDGSEQLAESAKGGSLISKLFAWLVELFNMFTRWIQK